MFLSRLRGTLQSLFKIKSVILKSTGVDGELEVRNIADTDYGDIKAGNLELTTPLPTASGGTGLSAIGADGEVLQVVSGNLAYVSLNTTVNITDTIDTVNLVNTLTFSEGLMQDLGANNVAVDFKGNPTTDDYNPVAVGSCALWFKSNIGITKDSLNQVSAWADQSGNGHSANQATALAQPIYTYAKSLNGYPQIYFDGVDDVLVTSSTPVSGAGARTMIIVGGWGCAIPVANNTRIIASWGGGSSNVEYGIATRVRPNNFGSAVKPAFGMYYYNNDYPTTAPSADSSPFIVCSSYDGTTDRMWYNNWLAYERVVALNTNTTPKFRIGMGSFGNATAANFLVAEIIVFSKALDSTERSNMFTELATKYNIEIAL